MPLKSSSNPHKIVHPLIPDDLNVDSPVEIHRWFSTTARDIYALSAEKMQQFIENKSAPEQLPDYIADYAPKSEYAVALSNLTSRVNRPTRYLPGLVAFALVHNCTPHEILFLTKKPVRISQRVSIFLRLLMEMDKRGRDAMESLLTFSSAQCRIHDISYVLKQRLTELAQEENISIERLLLTKGYTPHHRGTFYSYLEDPYSFMAKSADGCYESKGEFLDNMTFTMALYVTCLKYDLAADRLLMLDYSANACHADGTLLTADEKRYVSAFLKCDYATQCAMTAYLLNQHTSKPPVPSLTEEEE